MLLPRLFLSLLGFALAEIHEIEIAFSDKYGDHTSTLKLSNIKSPRAQATLDFQGALNFPVTLKMPSSIHWDQVRSESYVSTTIYRPSKIQILTDNYGNFISMSGIPFEGNTIDKEVEILQVGMGIAPDTQGFAQKVQEQKRIQETQPKGSWLSRNWMYVAIAVLVLTTMGGGPQQ